GRQVPIDRVVAKVGPAADEPAGEWRARIVEHALERRLPVNALRLMRPEILRVFDRAPVEFPVGRHFYLGLLRIVLILSTGSSILIRLKAACKKGSKRRR